MLRIKELATVTILLLLIACSNSLWDELPSSISTFISTYYPMSGISKYEEANGNYYVTVKNGASLVFDSNYEWKSINGNGTTLPEIFVTDKLPEKLVRYLTELEETNAVYAAENQPRVIILSMLNYKITYTKETEEVTQEE
ncbi:MAG: hypothetical protein HDS29_00255 [Bacteroides sp.]|nr:hypothetical protein [Bacteroides sp.]MBD5284695.1 hypothetical protein [Bacteroides sp.]